MTRPLLLLSKIYKAVNADQAELYVFGKGVSRIESLIGNPLKSKYYKRALDTYRQARSNASKAAVCLLGINKKQSGEQMRLLPKDVCQLVAQYVLSSSSNVASWLPR